MTRLVFVLATAALAFGALAQTSLDSAPRVPVHLPGKGLAQHEFMYTGESHDRRIFIVRHGEIVWTYDDPAGKAKSATPSCCPTATSCSHINSASA